MFRLSIWVQIPIQFNSTKNASGYDTDSFSIKLQFVSTLDNFQKKVYEIIQKSGVGYFLPFLAICIEIIYCQVKGTRNFGCCIRKFRNNLKCFPRLLNSFFYRWSVVFSCLHIRSFLEPCKYRPYEFMHANAYVSLCINVCN